MVKPLFTPTRYSKEPFLINGNSRCGDCEKENADYFFNIDDDWKVSIEFYIAYNALDELIRINISKNLEYAMYGNRN